MSRAISTVHHRFVRMRRDPGARTRSTNSSLPMRGVCPSSALGEQRNSPASPTLSDGSPVFLRHPAFACAQPEVIQDGRRSEYLYMQLQQTPQCRRKTSMIAVAFAGAALLSACGSSSSKPASTTKSTSASKAAGPEVVIKLIAFRPDHLTIKTGQTVTWSQTDPGIHTVRSGKVLDGASGVTVQPDGKFSSGGLATSKSFSHQFNAPGTYTYYCEVHPATMRGVITVTP